MDQPPYDEEYHSFVAAAQHAAKAGNAGHWPTVAYYLDQEIERLREELANLRAHGCGMTECGMKE